MKRILPMIFLLVAVILATPQLIAEDISPANQLGGEAIFTDQVDYMPGDTVHITGTGFEPGAQVVVRVTRPDGSIVTGDGSLTPGSDSVVTDADGNFVYDYILDGIEGTYVVDVIGAEDLILASTTFTDALPATVNLYADAALTILKQAFERGDTVYARATATAPDLVAKYRFFLYEPGGTLHSGYPTTCLTPSAGNLDDFHQILQTDPLSILAGPTPVTGGRWTYQLRYYANPTNCTNQTGGANLNKTFYVYQAYAYTDAASRNACVSDGTCGSPTPRPVVTPGSTVYLKVRGFTANRAACGIQFVRPDGSIACTIGPFTSDANGAYSFDYPSGSCPPISNTKSDIGCWTINVSGDYGPDFHPQFTANIDAFCVKALTTATTEVHNPDHENVSYVVQDTEVHDKLIVGGGVTDLPIGGTGNFTLFKGGTCSGDVVDSWTNVAVVNGEAESPPIQLEPGVYSYKAVYNGDEHYFGSEADCETFYVLPQAAVTSSSLCEFDVDGNSANGQQFRLIYTPEMASAAYKLNASNPGQFYYNAFVNASGPTTLTISVPYPFVTQGAMPVHVYSDLTWSFADGKWCFTPGTEIDAEDDQIVLESNYDAFGEFATISVDFDYDGIAYVTVHLDYGLKKTYAYEKNGTTLTATGIAWTPAAGTVITSPTSYTFSDSAGGSDTVQSINEFKRDPGIGGLVLKSGSDDPVAGVTVEIWQGTKKMATVKTDADGWYMWNYKYTGKAATFTVKLPAYSLSQTVTLKSNGYLVVNFTVP